MKLIDHLIQSIRSASVYNPEIQVAPACILWPDPDEQWASVIPVLQQVMPELYILGDYSPDNRRGPAIWLRCVLTSPSKLGSGESNDGGEFEGARNIPVFYLPGVSRVHLRAVETCPDYLKPLAELQYRGVIWSQVSSKDWTVLAWLQSERGGLGLNVAQDTNTKSSMLLALNRLLDEDCELLHEKRLDRDYFNTLLLGGDLIRDVLLWIDQEDVFKTNRDESAWKAFVEVCLSQLGFNPQERGVLAAAERLAVHDGAWQSVWDRFCEAPKRYCHIPEHIRKCKMPPVGLFANEVSMEGWPQWNEAQEKALRRELLALSNLPAHEASQKLQDLERQHCGRRQLVWTELGESPLACALDYLAQMVEFAREKYHTGTYESLLVGYQTSGWRVDDAALRALACVDSPEDVEAVTAAIRAVYLPWLDESARYLQGISPIPAFSFPVVTGGDETAILFIDGLRLDIGKRLVAILEKASFDVQESCHWSPLPSITATGKPACSPVCDQITGEDSTTDFEPVVKATGQSLKGGYHFKKLLIDSGWQIYTYTDKLPTNRDEIKPAWCEFGNIDSEGHHRGWKLAKHIDDILGEVIHKISEIFSAGWKHIQIVTDHGWLLLPGGLPKSDLPNCLTESKWGRCASLKPGVLNDNQTVPWFWNQNVDVAIAQGISCLKSGQEYAHGGLSLQECITPIITVSKKDACQRASVSFTDIVWKGLRCTIAVDGDYRDLRVDIRLHAGDPATSVVLTSKKFKNNGTVSVVVEDENLEGHQAFILLLDESGMGVSEIETVIGKSHMNL